MKLTLLILALTISNLVYSQKTAEKYTADGGTHLIGGFALSTLETDTLYSSWYQESYKAFEVNLSDPSWKEQLMNTEVEIFLGTWCGDSRNWVPKFVKLWDELGLQRDQLKFIALYGSGDDYKQGPQREEKGKNIHRVPTFIFKKDGTEYARIVESPRNDLVTDMAQIALGYPSDPNYRAANFLLDHFEKFPLKKMQEDFHFYLTNAYHLASKSDEMNTLGYVLLEADEIEKALFVFKLNTYIFRYEPNVYDSYGEAMAAAGRVKDAKMLYEKVLALDPENENAKQQLLALEE